MELVKYNISINYENVIKEKKAKIYTYNNINFFVVNERIYELKSGLFTNFKSFERIRDNFSKIQDAVLRLPDEKIINRINPTYTVPLEKYRTLGQRIHDFAQRTDVDTMENFLVFRSYAINKDTGEIISKDEFESDYIECYRCGEYHHIDSMIQSHDTENYFCESCSDNLYKCTICDNYFEHRIAEHSEGHACNYCLEYRDLNICNNCNMLTDSWDDNGLCPDCQDESNYNRESLSSKRILENTNNIYPYNYTYGIEIETSTSKGKHNFSGTFIQTEDGSINGYEYVSPDFKKTAGDKYGMSGDYGIEITKEFCKNLADAGIDSNKECGLHIHLGTTLRYIDYRKIMYVFKNFEESILYKMLPPSRKTGSWSLPFPLSFEEIERITNEEKFLRAYYMDDASPIVRIKEKQKSGKYPSSGNLGQQSRYLGLNLHSYLYRGTIEFRYHSGTVKEEKIINWLYILSIMLSYAQNNGFKKIKKEMQGNQLNFFMELIDRSKFSDNIKSELKAYIVRRIAKFAGQ